MTSSTQYAPRRAFSSSVRRMRAFPSPGDREAEVTDLLPDELLPGMLASRDARRRSRQNKMILTSLVGLAIVMIIGVTTAFMLTEPKAEPFAIETQAEIVTMQDLVG
jgi:hypothetical protein